MFKIESISIPNGVTIIDEEAFGECTALKNVVLPDSMVILGDGAFCSCTGLTSVFIPKNIESITLPGCNKDVASCHTFGGCTELTRIDVDPKNETYSSHDGVLYNKDKTELLLCPMGKKGSYIIPEGVTSIRRDAFSRCRGLINVTIPNTVTSIGDNAFSFSGLTDVTIPDTHMSIIGSVGSFAEEYAKKNKIQFKDIGETKFIKKLETPKLKECLFRAIGKIKFIKKRS